MSKLRIAMFVVFLSLLASLAEAHPGHGTTEPSSVLHVLSEPHVAFAFLAIAAAAISFAGLVRRSRRA